MTSAGTDVVVVHWPEQRDELARLARQGVPRLLLVAPSADPPEGGDILQDWVRLPGDERDVRARLYGLRRRATDLASPPSVDGHGRFIFGREWVQLSPIHERLARCLLAADERVVPDTDLLAKGWPGGTPSANALRVHLHRLRRLIRPLGLEIRGVRGVGWVLQRAAPSPPAPDEEAAPH